MAWGNAGQFWNKGDLMWHRMMLPPLTRTQYSSSPRGDSTAENPSPAPPAGSGVLIGPPGKAASACSIKRAEVAVSSMRMRARASTSP